MNYIHSKSVRRSGRTCFSPVCVIHVMMWLILCLCALAYAQDDGPRVNTTQGVIVGQRVEDGGYLAFYGIHYGGSTAGENRFKVKFVDCLTLRVCTH